MSKQPDAIFDYIVIGAGSAGCVIASRLTENDKARVLLIEAGGRDNRLSIKMPSAFYMPLHDQKINWGYYSEPEPGLDHRRIHCPRGKVLGGSSSINGMACPPRAQLGADGGSGASFLIIKRQPPNSAACHTALIIN